MVGGLLQRTAVCVKQSVDTNATICQWDQQIISMLREFMETLASQQPQKKKNYSIWE